MVKILFKSREGKFKFTESDGDPCDQHRHPPGWQQELRDGPDKWPCSFPCNRYVSYSYILYLRCLGQHQSNFGIFLRIWSFKLLLLHPYTFLHYQFRTCLADLDKGVSRVAKCVCVCREGTENEGGWLFLCTFIPQKKATNMFSLDCFVVTQQSRPIHPVSAGKSPTRVLWCFWELHQNQIRYFW